MKLSGFVKTILVLLLDFYAIYRMAGVEAAAAVTACIVLFVWLGEYVDVLKSRGIRADKVPGYEGIKLQNAYRHLSERILSKEGRNVGNIRLYILPSDEINAFAYGFNHIGVTRGALRNADGEIVDVDFNFVERGEFEKTYDVLEDD